MTEKQINELRASLPKWENGNPPTLTLEQQIISEELDIREFMLSCLAYGNDYFEAIKSSWYVDNRRPNDFDWDRLEKLGIKNGRQRVQELWDEMKKDFEEHATIAYHVYTDYEGCSYNSVVWDDEK
ncbi:MAG: hypothetical protein J6T10_00160 [Methanobrevibacter sp.]|nr:hypothetical protein [Methanobrevibacter sp.]